MGNSPSQKRNDRRIAKDAVQTAKKQFAVCSVCGREFEQPYRESLGIHSEFDTCGRCRTEGMSRKSKISIPYTPHPGQQLVHDSPARFKLLAAGSRWGKDRGMINEFIKKYSIMMSEPRGEDMVPKVHGWVVAPTFPLARQNWRELKHFFPQQWLAHDPYESDRIIETRGGGVIEVKSADNPENLVGVGLDIVLITEAGKIAHLDEVWANIETRLMSPGRGPGGRGGLGLINGTPTGTNYYHQMFCWGQKNHPDYDPDWESWQCPSYDNPYLTRGDSKFFEKIKKRYPKRIYDQEILALFLAEGNSVYPTAGLCATCTYEEAPPQPGLSYEIGYDPARVLDFSGVIIRDSLGAVAKICQWSGMPWTSQVDRIAELAQLYNYAHVVIDKTGLGETLPEALAQRGVDVEAIQFTNLEKERMVNHLAMLIEQQSICYPKNEVLLGELKGYEYLLTKSGLTRYAASGAGHDDLVSALFLAYKNFNIPEITLPFMGLLGGLPHRRASY